MYSVVLMAALSSSPATPSWGLFRHRGCCGGFPIFYGCYYSSGCCGGWSMGFGCWGGGCWSGAPFRYGCYSSGCWGSVPSEDNSDSQEMTSRHRSLSPNRADTFTGPRMTVARPIRAVHQAQQQRLAEDRTWPERQPLKKARAFAPATIVVHLPAQAQLSINRQVIRSDSTSRRYVSLPLQPGVAYTFTLKGKITREDWTVTSRKRVVLRAGEEADITLKFPPLGELAHK